MEATATVDFVPEQSEITVSYEEGSSKFVQLHDGSVVQLSKLAPDWDPEDRVGSVSRLYAARAKGEILTGLIYINQETKDVHETLNTVKRPLNTLTERDLCPGGGVLESINRSLR